MKFTIIASAITLAQTTLASVILSPSPSPNEAQLKPLICPDLRQLTDKYLFELSLDDFTGRRGARDPPSLVWGSDGCTYAIDNPFGYDFGPACQRHDFGYLNYREQGCFTKAAKDKIDDNFESEYV